ncbi:hypothetical protein CPB83DRAFT_903357 [Crepidotus variabilis]|uniref:Uncharacterized protein n=1 Tax=Crepidotus variabilis TaxID=179855 RepID=A0A9P6JT90_9AGAR|nr:hypothetical protein CPB83DRAFT_903357 [Crepidotus variabilis]
MSTVCSSTPTLTRTILDTTGLTSVSTAVSTITSRLDAITTTISTCIATGTGSSASCVPTQIVETLDGTGVALITTTIEITAIIDKVVTNTETLYSQACSVGNKPVPPPADISTSRRPADISTPAPTPIITTISGTKTTVYPSNTALGSSSSGSSSKKFPVGAVVGGVVGGLVLVGVIAFFGYKFFAKKMAIKRLNNMLDEDNDADVKPYGADLSSHTPPVLPHSQEPSNATTLGGQHQSYQAASPEMQQYPLTQQQSPNQPGQQGYQYQGSPEAFQSQNNRPTSGQYVPPVSTGSPPPSQAPYLTPNGGYPQQQQQNYATNTAPSPPPVHGMVYNPNLGYAPPPPNQYPNGYQGYAEPSQGPTS